MSTSPPPNAINRFTYDWLIRLFELYPVDKKYFYKHPNHGELYASKAKLASISPLFNRLANAYIPTVINYMMVNFSKNNNHFSNYGSRPNIKTVVTDSLRISKLSKAFIPSEFITKRMYFVTSYLSIRNISDLTPADLKHFLPGCTRLVLNKITLTETLKFSEIWPLLRHCKDITIKDVKDIVFDEDTTSMQQQPPHVFIETWEFYDFNIAGAQTLSLLEYFLTYGRDDSVLQLSFSDREDVDEKTKATVSAMVSWLCDNEFDLNTPLPRRCYIIYQTDVVIRKLGAKKVAVLSANGYSYNYRRHF